MIDLHCHFLPGVDDGPETVDESIAMARAAVADGITHSVFTSHVDPELYGNQRSTLAPVFAQFNQRLAQEGIALQTRLGGEARLCPELLELIEQEEVPFLGEVDGWRILLLEFPHQMVPVGSERFIHALLRQKIRPLIAHPERNKAIMAQPERVEDLCDAGCWLQLTAGSIAGRFGTNCQRVAHTLIEAGYYCLAATDAHNLGSRPPFLSEARDALTARYGAEVAQRMVVERPGHILGLPPT